MHCCAFVAGTIELLKMKNEFFVIGLDFDGTVVKHKFPAIGEEVPYCLDVLKALQSAGHKIVLNTMRSDRPEGAFLTDAVNFLTERGIELWGINENPNQKHWTTSPKVYAHLYIDDAALGVPLKQDTEDERPFVDWKAVGEMLLGHGYIVEKIVLP